MSAQRQPEKHPIQVLSLDAVTVDHGLQSRVATSLDYQREFSEAMLRGDVFPPVGVVWDGETYWLWDGFHRYGAAREASKIDRNLRGIRAEVREGTREDAIVLSAGANQQFSIPRTSNDIRKSVGMVLGLDEYRDWSVARIARHVGISESTCARHRAAWFAEHGLPLPGTVIGQDDRPVPTEHWGTPLYFPYETPRGYECRDGRGKRHKLGTNRKRAEAKTRELKRNEPVACRWGLSSSSKRRGEIIHLFAKNGVSLRLCDLPAGRFPGLWGATGHGRVVVWADILHPAALLLHAAIILGVRQHVDPSLRAVVVCYHGGAAPDVLDLYRALGAEFRTPEELIEEVKAGK